MMHYEILMCQFSVLKGIARQYSGFVTAVIPGILPNKILNDGSLKMKIHQPLYGAELFNYDT